MSSLVKLTSKQFLLMGRDPPGVRLELVNGEIIVSPSPSPRHSRIVIALISVLEPHVKNNNLGTMFLDTDTVFDDENTRRPDILFYSVNRSHLIDDRALHGPPDLCVEVISPSSEHIDRVEKFGLFESQGVAHYWIVDPDEWTIEAFSLRDGKFYPVARGGGSDVVRLPPFPDLEIPLASIWPRTFK